MKLSKQIKNLFFKKHNSRKLNIGVENESVLSYDLFSNFVDALSCSLDSYGVKLFYMDTEIKQFCTSDGNYNITNARDLMKKVCHEWYNNPRTKNVFNRWMNGEVSPENLSHKTLKLFYKTATKVLPKQISDYLSII